VDSIRRTQEACTRATAALTESNPNPNIEALRRHRSAVARNVKSLRTAVNALRRAAKRFGVESSVPSLYGAYDRLNAMRSGMQERARSYVQIMNRARRMGGDGALLANAVHDDISVMSVLADYMDDNANDTETVKLAAKARSMFDM